MNNARPTTQPHPIHAARRNAGLPEWLPSIVGAWRWWKRGIAGLFDRAYVRLNDAGAARDFWLELSSARGRLNEMQVELDRADRNLTAAKRDVELRDATITIRELEVRELTSVVERNRTRVEAETAAAIGNKTQSEVGVQRAYAREQQ